MLDAVAQRVRRFYEQNPFPNYDGYESVGDLLSRASRSVYAARSTGRSRSARACSRIGCGTGQLGAFLSVGGRAVVGVDMTRASLELAGGFKQRHGLRNCNFLHGNLFDLPLQPASFDLVICKGVLMATRDARAGLHAICRFLRPGGYLIIGLYNRFARLPTTLRRIYFRLTKADPRKIDYVMRKMAQSDQKLRAWYPRPVRAPARDPPHGGSGARLVRGGGHRLRGRRAADPAGRAVRPGAAAVRRSPSGSRLEHWLVQLSWLLTISREGALFDLDRTEAASGRAT